MVVESRRKSRTSEEITAELLVKRLYAWQLVDLLDLPRFERYQKTILPVVFKENGFRLADFEKVHTRSRGCEVEAADSGKTINVRIIGENATWREGFPIQHLKCKNHGSFSTPFYIYGGVRREINYQ